MVQTKPLPKKSTNGVSDGMAPTAPVFAWGRLRSELLWVYEGEVSGGPLDLVTDRRHGYWAWLLLSGEVRMGTDRQAPRARKGEWMICPNEVGRQIFSKGARIISVHFRAQWPSGENLFLGSRAQVFPSLRYPQLERSAKSLCKTAQKMFPGRARNLLVQPADYQTFWRLQKGFVQWLLDFSNAMLAEGRSFSQSGECDPRVVRVANYLNEAPLDEPFPEKHIQQETGLGRARIEQLFYRQFGVHTKEYWDRLRLQSAMYALEDDERSVKEVCHRVGFKQPSYFSRWFTKQAGMSPLVYRKNITQLRDRGKI